VPRVRWPVVRRALATSAISIPMSMSLMAPQAVASQSHPEPGTVSSVAVTEVVSPLFWGTHGIYPNWVSCASYGSYGLSQGFWRAYNCEPTDYGSWLLRVDYI
jgi:hypothetical protein